MLTVFGSTGCDKFVQATVVTESAGKVEKDIAVDNEEMGKTVPEQVAAPDKYEVSVTKTQTVMQDSGEEMNQTIQIISDVPVEIPDVDAIYRKKTVITRWSEEQINRWIDSLSAGKLRIRFDGADNPNAINTGWEEVVETDSIPYISRYHTFNQEDEDAPAAFFAWEMAWDLLWWDGSNYYNENTGEKIPAIIVENPGFYVDMAEDYFEKMGISDFKLAAINTQECDYELYGNREEPLTITTLVYERMVDGVPVTWTYSGVYPTIATIWEQENYDYQRTDHWYDETVSFSFTSGNLEEFSYMYPLEIVNASDTALYLLPFEEICQIFENTVADLVSGVRINKDLKYVADQETGVPLRQYPSKAYEKIMVELNAVRFGYMQVRTGDDYKEGALIPVWDFIGTWAAETDTDGTEVVSEKMKVENVSLLTVDACDGTVIQRWR